MFRNRLKIPLAEWLGILRPVRPETAKNPVFKRRAWVYPLDGQLGEIFGSPRRMESFPYIMLEVSREVAY